MENAVEQMQFLLNTLDKIPFLVLIIIAFAITLIENLFPPAPSDITFVAICIVVGLTQQPLVPIIISGTIGATLGFWIMYWLGRKFDSVVIENNRIRFISKESIDKVSVLFQKWGMKIVVINRFLSGTRAIIGFFVGMMALPKTKTMIFAGISSLTFYGILAVVGYYFGRQDWEIVIKYLHIYEKIALAIGAILLIGLISFWIFKKISNKKKSHKETN